MKLNNKKSRINKYQNCYRVNNIEAEDHSQYTQIKRISLYISNQKAKNQYIFTQDVPK